jgi:hypothetical protein
MTPRWRRVGYVLALGAVYDGAFAVAILLFTKPAAALLRLPIPDDPFHLHLNGVLLLLLAGLYAVAARKPARYHGVAPVSALGRVLGFGLFAWTWAGGRPTMFLALGVADLAIGVATFVLWRRASVLSA